MDACETTPPASTGTTHTTLTIQYRDRPFLALEDLPPLAVSPTRWRAWSQGQIRTS
jgi:hypothetical protein